MPTTVTPADGTVGRLAARIAKEPGSSTGSGTIAWDYSVDHSAVATLEQGQTRVERFTVTVDDGHGGTAQQSVTVTVRGSASSPTTQVLTASATQEGATQPHAEQTGTTSTGSLDPSLAANAHGLETHHGHGLTGFEI
ncbi:VCBS repeat-containing protein [Methylobacterium sp. PvR107]|nr:VCBS repeat-containing protein [Methylobacterium sp. PvR107]